MSDAPRMFSAATAFDTPAGACGLAWSGAGLTRVRPFEDGLACAAARVSKQGAVLVPGPEVPPHIAAVIAALRAFLSGVPTAFDDVALDFSGLSDFEAALYGALRAARAVGVAMGRNPWPLIVPCHHVLTSDGKLGGFSAPGGGRTKSALLAREGVHLDGGQLALFD